MHDIGLEPLVACTWTSLSVGHCFDVGVSAEMEKKEDGSSISYSQA